MAERNVHRISAGVLILTLAAGVAALQATSASVLAVIVGAAAISVAQLVSVPAPSGARLHLGIAVAAAVPLLAPDAADTIAVLAFGMAGSLVVTWLLPSARSAGSARFLSDLLAVVAYASVYYVMVDLVTLDPEANPALFDWWQLFALGAGGVAWYAVRAFLQSLVGLEREDLSARYLWLLGLEDWSAVVSLFIAGALFGLAWPTMRMWAVPMAAMPYAFSHLAFVRYNGTRVTYGQMIRALGQIPEVAGLAAPGHATRTADLAVAMARELGLHPDDVVELEYAALMHDVGRITLNEPAILRAGYTDEDIARWGAQIIAESPYLTHVAELVRAQHQPYRRAGQERDLSVPMASKIIKVASAYDQAEHEMGLRPIDAIEQVHRGSAYDYDPEVAASLRRVLTHRGVLV
ncbi:MAG: HD domain-containing protein [Acidimicrobiia bacterium]|nr:HD domain-containing protein [Acidimicrobiia bacterium]